MSDEEAEEFEQRRPWLAKAAGLLGSGLATVQGLAEVAVVLYVYVFLGVASVASTTLQALGISAGVVVIALSIIDIDEFSDSAHPAVVKGLNASFLLWFYLLGIGIGMAVKGNPYSDQFILASLGFLAIVAIAEEFIFSADAMFHDRLFGEVSTS